MGFKTRVREEDGESTIDARSTDDGSSAGGDAASDSECEALPSLRGQACAWRAVGGRLADVFAFVAAEEEDEEEQKAEEWCHLGRRLAAAFRAEDMLDEGSSIAVSKWQAVGRSVHACLVEAVRESDRAIAEAGGDHSVTSSA